MNKWRKVLKSYKNSNLRLTLLLAQFSIICYTLINGDDTAAILALMLLGLWGIAVKTWLEK